MFATNGDSAARAESAKKAWQQVLLKRWLQLNYVTDIGAGVFSITELGTHVFRAVIKDHDEGSGSVISAILWPKEDIEMRDAPSFSAPVVAAATTVEEPVEDDLSGASTQAILRVLDAIAQSIGSSTQDTYKSNLIVVQSLSTGAKALEDLLKKLDHFKDEQEAGFARGVQTAGAANKRIEALESRMVDLVKIIEANQTAVKRTATGFEDVLKLLGDLRAMSEPIVALKSELGAFVGRVDKLLASNEETKKDRLGKLASRLNASIEESALLRDEILNILSDEEKNGAGS